jgi:hypothetical protein
MRLLELKEDGEVSLTKELIKEIPPYAILSHTWGDDGDEVTFKDLTEGSGKTKIGYRKIQFCGKQAALDRLQFFWLDTCCIDKSNGAELSEAIISMFRWYRNAKKCYVYLADVSTNSPDAINEPAHSWEQDFRKSRWFTRGWTLQELIAPLSVEFFSMNGKLLGNKRSLERQLHEITDIAVRTLQGCSLSEFSVNERLSWAQGRETKREEDLAYSLLGIFDIQIPALYGEGKESAFRRLQQELYNRSRNYSVDDLPKFLQKSLNFQERQESPHIRSSVTHMHWKVPHSINTFFTGRIKLLERIKDAIHRELSEQKVFVITGLGGLGKSETCLKIANEIRQEYAILHRILRVS